MFDTLGEVAKLGTAFALGQFVAYVMNERYGKWQAKRAAKKAGKK